LSLASLFFLFQAWVQESSLVKTEDALLRAERLSLKGEHNAKCDSREVRSTASAVRLDVHSRIK
jgi:hypothetical protein